MPTIAAAPMFGRDAELTEVRRLLAHGPVRLLTLTGPGGTGKTRLAQAVAAGEAGLCGRSVYLVDLAAVDDSSDVPTSVAQVLGVQESGSAPLEATLHAVIGRSTMLLVLDNFERVLGAATWVADLLERAPDLACLVTSREPLHIRAERVYPIGPLPVPDARVSALAAIAGIPSVALFVDRGQARQPSFGLTRANAADVAEICRRLDGLPLAIELAAAQVSVLSPHAILARLEAHEPFVLGGVTDLPARHRTLDAAVRWSFDLLDATERLVFLRCGVFSGSIGPEAVAALDEPPNQLKDPLGALAQLADKNLLQVVDPASDEPRFRMLETIRAFALAETTELGDLRRRYANYFVGFAEHAAGALLGQSMGDTLDRLESEYDNFRAVLHWSLNGGEISVGLRLAGALYRFWMLRGHLAEARQWLERALPRSQNVTVEVRAKALNAAGVVAGMQGDKRAAEVSFLESFRLWQQLGDPISMAATMGNLGLVAQDRHDVARALECFQRAEALYATGGDRRGIAVSLGSRARLARQEGSALEAALLFEQALAQFREVGDPRGIANSLANLGHALLALRKPEQSIPYFREALELRGQLGNTLGIAECLEGFAGVAIARGRPRRAARLLGAAEALREITGAPLPETDRQQFESLVRRIRQRLNADTFAREQAAGAALAPEQAAQYALVTDVEPVAADAASQRPALPSLTEREREVAALVARGLTNPQIADTLHLTRRTIGTHLEHIFAKLGVQARAEVAVWITHQGGHSQAPADR